MLCDIIPKAKVPMLTYTKEQQCRLTNKAEEDSGNQSKAYGSRLSKVSYVTDLEKNQRSSLELASPGIA